jgi:hypothetical protein
VLDATRGCFYVRGPDEKELRMSTIDETPESDPEIHGDDAEIHGADTPEVEIHGADAPEVEIHGADAEEE